MGLVRIIILSVEDNLEKIDWKNDQQMSPIDLQTIIHESCLSRTEYFNLLIIKLINVINRVIVNNIF